MLESETDGALVRAIVSSSGKAKEQERELCRRFAPRIRLYGLRHLGAEDRARDLVQAVSMAVLEAVRAGRVVDADRVERFVLGTCRNVAAEMRRADARAEPKPSDELDVLSFSPEPEHVDVVALFRCFAELDERARTVVHLTFTEDQSADEIAAALGMTAGNVRVLRHRAIARLRQCLDGKGAG